MSCQWGGQGGGGTGGECGFGCGQPHPSHLCSKTLDVRLGKIQIPKTVCRKCCRTLKQGQSHPADCHLYEFVGKSDGRRLCIDRLCPAHPGKAVHTLLCIDCGAEPKRQVTSEIPTLPAHVTPLSPLRPAHGEAGEGRGEGIKIPEVVFLSEILNLIGRDGARLRVIIHYDSLSGCSFSCGVPEEFNHGEQGVRSELFNMSTFMGTSSYSLPAVTLKVETQGNRCPQTIVCYTSDFPAIPSVCLPPGLHQLRIGNASPDEEKGVAARLLLGAEYSSLHPRSIKAPAPLKSHPGLVAFKSHFSGKILLAGRMDKSPDTG